MAHGFTMTVEGMDRSDDGQTVTWYGVSSDGDPVVVSVPAASVYVCPLCGGGIKYRRCQVCGGL